MEDRTTAPGEELGGALPSSVRLCAPLSSTTGRHTLHKKTSFGMRAAGCGFAPHPLIHHHLHPLLHTIFFAQTFASATLPRFHVHIIHPPTHHLYPLPVRSPLTLLFVVAYYTRAHTWGNQPQPPSTARHPYSEPARRRHALDQGRQVGHLLWLGCPPVACGPSKLQGAAAEATPRIRPFPHGHVDWLQPLLQ